MRIFLLGKIASITHWLEDAAAAFAAEGHAVALGVTRRPWVNLAVESALAGPLAARLVSRVRRFQPEVILAIGGYHVPPAILAALAALPGRPPLVGWVGDLFDGSARDAAALFDAAAYTDSALVSRHETLGFKAKALFLPHAVDPQASWLRPAVAERRARMAFVANPTAHRCAVVDALDAPITLHGAGWRPASRVEHEVHARRAAKRELGAIYGAHLAALNIRNEHNVLAGLNQRSFEPCLTGAVMVTDDQPDLERCFNPGVEVLVWHDTDELNALYARLRGNPAQAAAVGERGRRRVLAEHTYARRLKTLIDALG